MRWLTSIVVKIGLYWVAMKSHIRRGRLEQQVDAMEQINDDNYKAKVARDNLRANPDERERLRERHTRDG